MSELQEWTPENIYEFGWIIYVLLVDNLPEKAKLVNNEMTIYMLGWIYLVGF